MAYQRKLSSIEANDLVETALARHNQGDIAYAAGVYREVLAQYPYHPRALQCSALAAQQSGNYQEAIRLLERSISAAPSDTRAHNHLGFIYVLLNDKPGAAACFERSLQIDPDHVASLINLANLTMKSDPVAAVALYRRALAASPESAFVVFSLAQALNEDRCFDEALQLYKRTIALDPKHLQARFQLGLLLEQRGQFADALEQYSALQRLEPDHVPSLANALAIRDFVPDAARVRRAEEMAGASNTKAGDKIKLHRALGKYYEQSGSYESAFRHFTDANALFRSFRPKFDIAAFRAIMQRLRHVIGREVFAGNAASATCRIRPIFIVGLHRSGTTLVEQIIASHPQVYGAGELLEIPNLVKKLGAGYPECLVSMDPDALHELADEYMNTVTRRAPPEALCVTDKMPLNGLHLGLIAVLFRDARVIYCRRDPLDIAISCYTELFELEHDYTTNLEDFGQYFLEHERLMAHWKSVLPVPILEVCYEDLVGNVEAVSRTLIEHCGLEWEPACLNFQKSGRTVQTPSRWQVRQPIYQTAVGRWGRYRTHMRGLLQYLSDFSYTYPGKKHLEPEALERVQPPKPVLAGPYPTDGFC